jgi:hypothetical protein
MTDFAEPTVRIQLPPAVSQQTFGSSPDEERRRRVAEAGALQFLTKPVDFDLLKRELGRLPDNSRR